MSPTPRFEPARLVLILCLLLPVSAAQSFYSPTKIGPLPTHNGSLANAISQSGVVVGWSDTVQGYRWQDGVLAALPTFPGGNMSRGEGVGAGGRAVGSANSGSHADHAVIWTPLDGGGFSMLDLGVAPGDLFSLAEAINPSGTVVGCTDSGFRIRPAVWTRASWDPPGYQITVLPLLANHTDGIAFDIDPAGAIVGLSSDGIPQAVRWVDSGSGWHVTNLGSLTPGFAASAEAVNAFGVVVGYSVSAVDFVEHAVAWVDGGIVDLGTLDGKRTFARAINRRGDVVGDSIGVGIDGAWVRPAGQAGIFDLDGLLPPGTPWDTFAATGINDAGRIVGYGDIGGFIQSFILTPVTMFLEGPSPGVAGQSNTLVATRAAPGALIRFYRSTTGGETALPGCGAVTLDLASPVLLGTATANDAGRAVLTVNLPGDLGGTTQLFQAADIGACRVTNVNQVTL